MSKRRKQTLPLDAPLTDLGHGRPMTRRDLIAQVVGHLPPAPAVAQGNGHRPLGPVLADYIFVQLLNNLGWG